MVMVNLRNKVAGYVSSTTKHALALKEGKTVYL